MFIGTIMNNLTNSTKNLMRSILFGFKHNKDSVKFAEVEFKLPISFFDEYEEEWCTTYLSKQCVVNSVYYHFGYNRVTDTIYYYIDKPELIYG